MLSKFRLSLVLFTVFSVDSTLLFLLLHISDASNGKCSDHTARDVSSE